MPAIGRSIGGLTAAALLGAVDGFAASADINAGRGWDSPGVAVIPQWPVLNWGWAPVAQSSMVAGGGAAMLAGQDWGEIPFVVGAALISRALTFKFANRNNPAAPATQGWTWVPPADGYPTPAIEMAGELAPIPQWRDGIDERPGSLAYGIDQQPGTEAWAVDQSTGSLA